LIDECLVFLLDLVYNPADRVLGSLLGGNMKRLFFICMIIMGVSFLGAQQRSETTAEQEYLSNLDDIILTELAQAEDRDTLNLALEFAAEAIQKGRATEGTRKVLEGLAGMGTLSVSDTSGRVSNNYTEIRREACDLLAQIPTKESKETLKKIAKDDTEPMVATAAIRALGEIGMNEQNDVIDTIIWTQKKFANTTPVSSLALEVLNAFAKLDSTIKDPLSRGQMIQSITEIASNYHYAKPVRDKALNLLRTFAR
jgi:hypothetical protein